MLLFFQLVWIVWEPWRPLCWVKGPSGQSRECKFPSVRFNSVAQKVVAHGTMIVRLIVNTHNSALDAGLLDSPCPLAIHLPSETKIDPFPSYVAQDDLLVRYKWWQIHLSLVHCFFSLTHVLVLILRATVVLFYVPGQACYVACHLKVTISFELSFEMIQYNCISTTFDHWTRIVEITITKKLRGVMTVHVTLSVVTFSLYLSNCPFD